MSDLALKRLTQRWLLPAGLTVLALLAPLMLVYDAVYQLNPIAGEAGQSSFFRLGVAASVAIVFWLFTGLLLIRRYQEGLIRLFYVHGQVLAITMVYPLAHPSPWQHPPGLMRLSILGFYFLGPLTLHLHITFPVRLGAPAQRRRFLILLYLAACASAATWLLGIPALQRAGEIFTIGVFSAAIAVLVYAYWFRAGPDDRRRLRLIWFGTLLAILLSNSLYFVPGLYGWPTPIPLWLVGLLLITVPFSYLYAITRQNLFGIDRLLNRTLVYFLLIAGIFVVYLAPLLLLSNLFPGDWLAQAAVSTALTLLIGWNFSWLRTRLERMVDQLFYGSWYDYPGVVENISGALARCTDRAQLADVLTRQVPARMNLQPGRLWIGETGGEALAPEEVRLNLEGEVPAIWQVAPRLDGSQLTTSDLRILNTLALQAEVALHNVLLIERLRRQLDEIRASRQALAQTQRQLLRSREEERARLARELHDGPLQALIGMNMQLGLLAASARTPAGEPTNGTVLQDLRGEVRTLLDDLRAVCAELRPPMLDTLGLGAALSALAQTWSQQHGVAVQLNLPPDAELRSLPGEAVVNLYRIAQEALANVARHAGAAKVELELSYQAGQLQMRLCDDGCGFYVPAALHDLAEQNHFGLVGMYERAELIGGSLQVNSQPGQGTSILVRL